jgi:hypothetical protein
MGKIHLTGGENMISKDMPITEIVKNYPETIEILEGYGMHCFG